MNEFDLNEERKNGVMNDVDDEWDEMIWILEIEEKKLSGQHGKWLLPNDSQIC